MLVRKVFILSCVFLILTLPLSPARTESTDPQKDTEGKSAVPRENLGGLIYPAGIQVLPASTSPLVDRLGGNVFKFSTTKLTRDPYLREGIERGTYADFRKRLIDGDYGDILYESTDGGYFIALSGKITDLGKHYLYEYDDKPWPMASDSEGTNDKGFGGKGLMPKPLLGHCYALRTVDNNPILFRIIALNEQGAKIQWILNSRGGGKARIPKCDLIAPENEPVSFVPEGLLLDDSVTKNITAHARYRDFMIKRLIAVVADTHLSPETRESAINLLGVMRAEEAVDILLNNMGFISSGGGKMRTEMQAADFVAMNALIKIGKPASLAAVTSLRSMGVFSPQDIHKWASCWQMVNLIVRIEGPTIAKIMLEDAMAEELKLAGEKPKADDPHKIAADNLKKAIDMMAQIPAYE